MSSECDKNLPATKNWGSVYLAFWFRMHIITIKTTPVHVKMFCVSMFFKYRGFDLSLLVWYQSQSVLIEWLCLTMILLFVYCQYPGPFSYSTCHISYVTLSSHTMHGGRSHCPHTEIQIQDGERVLSWQRCMTHCIVSCLLPFSLLVWVCLFVIGWEEGCGWRQPLTEGCDCRTLGTWI